MALEPKLLGSGDFVGDPDLPHVMRLCRFRVPVHYVLNWQCEDVAAGVAGQGGRCFCRKHDHDGADNVGDGLGGNPTVIIVRVLTGRELSSG